MNENYIKKREMELFVPCHRCRRFNVDIWLCKKRDTQVAYAFLKRLRKQFNEPKVLVTDKAPSISSAFNKLHKNRLYMKTEH